MSKEEKIKAIRKLILKNVYPLTFDWRDHNIEGNCYSYAISSNFEDKDMEGYIYNLGIMSGLYPAKSIIEAKKAFVADMETIGIYARESSFEEQISIEKQEWKIAFFYDCFCEEGYYDFHFMRQDKDMQWSHKEFWRGPIRGWGNDNPKFYKTELEFIAFYILKVLKHK